MRNFRSYARILQQFGVQLNAALSDEEILEFEAVIGLKIPDVYKLMLKNFDGFCCESETSLIKVWDTKEIALHGIRSTEFETYLTIADYMIDGWRFEISCADTAETPVYIFDTQATVAFKSLWEFLDYCFVPDGIVLYKIFDGL